MKKIVLLLFIAFTINLNAQHFVPLKLSVSPDKFDVALYGGFSLDKGSEPEFIKSLSNTAQSGFIINALYFKRGSHSLWFNQFMLDINPIIINWDPFTWNKLVSQPVDSFYVHKMPYAEDAFLHIGWHITHLQRVPRKKYEYTIYRIFNELYYRPYSIDKTVNNETINYRFSTVNFQTGFQFGYVQKEVPTLGTFLIALSGQFNIMMINEQDAYIHNFSALTNYTDKNFWGPGGKLSLQTNFLNVYFEVRQYYGFTTGEKFTQDATLLVGAFGNISWTTKRRHTETDNGGEDVFE